MDDNDDDLLEFECVGMWEAGGMLNIQHMDFDISALHDT